MKKIFNEGNQIHNFMSSSGSGTVINYGSGSGSDFLTSYGSGYGSGSTSQKVTVPTVPVPVPVPVPQHCQVGPLRDCQDIMGPASACLIIIWSPSACVSCMHCETSSLWWPASVPLVFYFSLPALSVREEVLFHY
jgi:hypothetical protein